MHKALLTLLVLVILSVVLADRPTSVCGDPTGRNCNRPGVATSAATTLAYTEEEASTLSNQQPQFRAPQRPPTPQELAIQRKFWNQLKQGNLITPDGQCATHCEWFVFAGGHVRVRTEEEKQQAQQGGRNSICQKCQASWIVYDGPCYKFPAAFTNLEITGRMAENIKQQCIRAGSCSCDPEEINDDKVRSIRSRPRDNDIRAGLTSIARSNPKFNLATIWNSFGAWFTRVRPLQPWALQMTNWVNTNPVLQQAPAVWRPSFPFYQKTVSWLRRHPLTNKVWNAFKTAPAWFKDRVTRVKAAAARIGQKFSNAVKSVGAKVGGAFGKVSRVAAGIRNRFGGAINKARGVAAGIRNRFGGAVNKARNAVSTISRRFGGAVNKARGVAAGIRNRLGGFTKNVGGRINGKLSRARQAVRNTVQKATTAAKSVVSRARSAIRSRVSRAAQKVSANKAVNAARSAVKSAARSIGNFAGRAFRSFGRSNSRSSSSRSSGRGSSRGSSSGGRR